MQNTNNPALDNFSIVDNSNCGVANANGQVAIQVDTAANYAFQWFESDTSALGSITATATIDADTAISGLLARKYIVEITDTTGANLGCSATFSFTVGSGISSMIINNLAVTNKTNCSPANGGANAIQIMEDSVLYPAASGDYEFEWFNNLGVSFAGPAPATSVTGLDTGLFRVRATNVVTHCISPFRQFNVNQATANPAIASNMVTPNSACVGINPMERSA